MSEWTTIDEVSKRDVFKRVRLGDEVAILIEGSEDYEYGTVVGIDTYKSRSTRWMDRPVLYVHPKDARNPHHTVPYYESVVEAIFFKNGDPSVSEFSKGVAHQVVRWEFYTTLGKFVDLHTDIGKSDDGTFYIAYNRDIIEKGFSSINDAYERMRAKESASYIDHEIYTPEKYLVRHNELLYEEGKK